MRRLLLVLGLAAPLAAPAAALATPPGEVPFAQLDGDVSCVSATGAPDELAVAGDDARGRPGIRLLRAGPAGLEPAGRVPVGRRHLECGGVAARPGGSALAAGVDAGADGLRSIVAAWRPAGGGFGSPLTVVGSLHGGVRRVVPLLDDRGDAVVVWLQAHGPLRAAVRPPGGSFGAPVTLAAAAERPGRLRAGLGADGQAVVVWASRVAGSFPTDLRVRVSVDLRPARTVATISATSAAALAVAGDGRALLALPERGAVRVSERPPGGEFGAPVTVGPAPDPGGELTAAAAATDGAAAVLWTGFLRGATLAVTRPAAGAFGAPVTLSRGWRLSGEARILASERVLDAIQAIPANGEGRDGRVAVGVTPSGARAAWLGRRLTAGVRAIVVRSAALPSAGPPERAVLSSPLRDAKAPFLVPGPGGDAGVAWLDYGDSIEPRLHVALPGVAERPDGPAPGLHVGAPELSTLDWNDPLFLRARCRPRCDVRAQTAGLRADSSTSFVPGGGPEITFAQRSIRPIAPPGGGPVRIRFLYGAPGAHHPRARTATVRLRLHPVPATPRPSALRAVRAGDVVRVSWRTQARSEPNHMIVIGRASPAGPPLTAGAFAAGDRRRFAVRLRHARAVRFVTLHLLTWRGTDVTRTVRVRA